MILQFALEKDLMWCLLYKFTMTLQFNIQNFYCYKKLAQTCTTSVKLHKSQWFNFMMILVKSESTFV